MRVRPKDEDEETPGYTPTGKGKYALQANDQLEKMVGPQAWQNAFQLQGSVFDRPQDRAMREALTGGPIQVGGVVTGPGREFIRRWIPPSLFDTLERSSKTVRAEFNPKLSRRIHGQTISRPVIKGAEKEGLSFTDMEPQVPGISQAMQEPWDVFMHLNPTSVTKYPTLPTHEALHAAYYIKPGRGTTVTGGTPMTDINRINNRLQDWSKKGVEHVQPVWYENAVQKMAENAYKKYKGGMGVK